MPPDTPMLFRRAIEHHQCGRLQQAEAIYQQILRQVPNHAETLHLLGAIRFQQGHLDGAAAVINQAINARPSEPIYYNDLGVVLKKQGKLNEAVACYRKALSLKPNFAEAHHNLGNVFREQDNLVEAEISYRQALSILPDYVEAFCNLAYVLKAQGRADEAIRNCLAALRLTENTNAKICFAQIIRGIDFKSAEPAICELVTRAISEAWSNPDELLIPAISLIALNQGVKEGVERANKAWPKQLSEQELFGDSGLALVADDKLFQLTLETISVNRMEFERFLTMARHILLDAALKVDSGESKNNALGFYCALARQCFINEYIFACTAEEISQVESLRKKLIEKLKTKAPIPPLWLSAVGAYSPLDTVPSADALLEMRWPDAIAALLKQQISEPREEINLRNGIALLTAVDNISAHVQKQYEENPYPRWVKAGPADQVLVNDYFHQHFPKSSFQSLAKNDQADILIAGCGTGLHSIDVARTFRGAKVLAVDLSLTSLSYAKRKTEELGLKNIEYARADILKLGDLNRTFDIVESVGVLHHLVNPLDGWRILLNLLKPGGLMKIGLYSERARQVHIAARNYIAEGGYTDSAEDIRRCRQDLMADERFQSLLTRKDFYATSDCRDLLFHVQECRFTPLQIKEILDTLGLTFIGFEPRDFRQYLMCFPEDTAKTNLENWEAFEIENPGTFPNMFQFWVQKI